MHRDTVGSARRGGRDERARLQVLLHHQEGGDPRAQGGAQLPVQGIRPHSLYLVLLLCRAAPVDWFLRVDPDPGATLLGLQARLLLDLWVWLLFSWGSVVLWEGFCAGSAHFCLMLVTNELESAEFSAGSGCLSCVRPVRTETRLNWSIRMD